MIRIGDIEFRGGNPQIVKHWNKDGTEFCYTLMFFERDKEGYFARFVGRRPLDYDNPEALWKLMKYAQTVLDAAYELEKA